MRQRIEDVRTLAGQTVAISFWAKASSATTLSAALGQNFGSGGSTAVFQGFGSQAIGTSWTRFVGTVTVPSISGKTVGTNSYLECFISNPNNETNTIDLWGVQLEAGSVATPFRRNANSIQGELAACQRYYRRIQPGSGREMANGTMITTSIGRFYVAHAPTMRAGASITSGGTFDVLSGATLTPTGAISGVSAGFVGATFQVGVTPTTTTGFSALLRSQSADGFVAFDAEL
jgi:hypothetical protein